MKKYFKLNCFYERGNVSSHFLESGLGEIKVARLAMRLIPKSKANKNIITKMTIQKLDMRRTRNKELLERREKGGAGLIWNKNEYISKDITLNT